MHTYSFDAIHLWHPFEKNTTKEINEKLNEEYEKYDFYDYFDIIKKYNDIGSPIKYSYKNYGEVSPNLLIDIYDYLKIEQVIPDLQNSKSIVKSFAKNI